MKVRYAWTVLVLGIVGFTNNAHGTWGSIELRSDTILLENQKIRLMYAKKVFGDGNWTFCITDLRDKRFPGENYAGREQIDGLWQSAGTGTGIVKHTEITTTDDSMTIAIEYDYARVRLSIFPYSSILRVHYVDPILETVDLATPAARSGTIYFYGEDQWAPNRTDYQEYPGSYYNSKEYDDPEDGGSLNYNGWFLAGVYDQSTGRGIVRVMPVADISIIKVLSSSGFEFFPHYSGDKGGKRGFTCYLALTENGEDGGLALAQQIADWANGGSIPGPGLVGTVSFPEAMRLSIHREQTMSGSDRVFRVDGRSRSGSLLRKGAYGLYLLPDRKKAVKGPKILTIEP